MPDLSLWRRITIRFCSTFLSSSSRDAIFSLILRLSISSFVSPGPLAPNEPDDAAPPCRESSFPRPTSLGEVYFSCASSTWSRPSLVLAWSAKMSRMSMLLSITETSDEISSSIDFICDGESSPSNTTSSAPRDSQSCDSSVIFPFPRTVLTSGVSLH